MPFKNTREQIWTQKTNNHCPWCSEHFLCILVGTGRVCKERIMCGKAGLSRWEDYAFIHVRLIILDSFKTILYGDKQKCITFLSDSKHNQNLAIVTLHMGEVMLYRR